MMKKWLLAGVLIGGVCGMQAAEPTPEPTPPIDNLVVEWGGADPIEGFNRSMFEVNNFFMRWIYRPVGIGYGAVMPRPGVNMVNRFADNVGFPPRMFSSFAQAKWRGGGIEFLRFLTNTTVGIAGLFDPATAWFDLPRQDEDFGQAFASWGIGPGCALTLPGVGAGNVRDSVGCIFDYALDPKTYFNGAQAAAMLHAGLDPYPVYEKLRWSSRDSYYTYRQMKLILRELQLNDWTLADAKTAAEADPGVALPPPTAAEQAKLTALHDAVWQSPVIDTLRVQWFRPQNDNQSMWVNLSPWNSDFDNQAGIREVKIDLTDQREPMPYRYWAAPNQTPDTPLAILLPGLGGHCMGAMTVPLAEIFYNRGWNVVVLSSAFNWEFAATALPGGIPGYTPTDAEAIRRAIFRIKEDLNHEFGTTPRQTMLAGYSQGALHTLFIAQQEQEQPYLNIDRYLAINPPVDMYYGLTALDAFYRTGASWSVEEAKKRVINAAGVYLAASKMPVTPEAEVPVGEADARFLVGYGYRLTLTELLGSIHQRNALPPVTTPYRWSNQAALYEELSAYSYEWYVQQVLLPYYAALTGANVTLENFNAQAGLRAVAPQLQTNAKVRVLTNYDDFLLTETDREFLRDTFGDRLKMFDHGGHLGNLYHPEVQTVIQSAIP